MTDNEILVISLGDASLGEVGLGTPSLDPLPLDWHHLKRSLGFHCQSFEKIYDIYILPSISQIPAGYWARVESELKLFSLSLCNIVLPYNFIR